VKIRHQTDVRDSRVLPGPIPPGRPQHSRARAVIIDDELDRAAADSAPLPRLNSPEGHAAQGSSGRSVMLDMEVIARRQDHEHCASITCMIRHYVARRAQVTEGHPHNADERALG
jgi:hypothetical protein